MTDDYTWEDLLPAVRDRDPGICEMLTTELGKRHGSCHPDRILGCLLGGAVGDALGYPVEFEGEDRLFKLYGPQGIADYDLMGGLARISDDTQMTLFTANGLMAADYHHLPYRDAVASAYHDWITTQFAGKVRKTRKKLCWLLNERRLYAARAPGNTCLSAIEKGAWGTPEKPINDSKGCGGVMRVAPVGLFRQNLPLPTLDVLAADAAAVTHGHPLGFLPGAMLCHMVYLSAFRDNLSLWDIVADARDGIKRLFYGIPHLQELIDLVDRAVELAKGDRPDLDCIHALGGGWVGEETLAIAVFCALRHCDDFGAAIRASVNHKGDSDSTGAVTGNLLGAYLGAEAIPQRYLDKLELKDVICQVAEDLAAGDRVSHSWEKYKVVTFSVEHP